MKIDHNDKGCNIVRLALLKLLIKLWLIQTDNVTNHYTLHKETITMLQSNLSKYTYITFLRVLLHSILFNLVFKCRGCL